jgi:hypothetical protein
MVGSRILFVAAWYAAVFPSPSLAGGHSARFTSGIGAVARTRMTKRAHSHTAQPRVGTRTGLLSS